MTNLAAGALAAGAAHAVLGGWMWARPAAAQAALGRLPRSRRAAWLLCAVDLAWVLWIIHGASWGRFAVLKTPVYVAGPIAWFAITRYLDELLTSRALGGLLLLAANPLLAAARWHPSASSRLVSAVVYAWVVAAIFLVMSPFWFRRAVVWMGRTPARWRLVSACLAVLGLGLSALALTAWR